MTINEAIAALDADRQNTFSRQEKIAWLSRLDGRVWEEIFATHRDQPAPFAGYSPETDPDRVLLVNAPWDEIYLRYMQAQMDSANGEIARYENSAALFQGAFEAFRNHYNRTHAPKGRSWRYF